MSKAQARWPMTKTEARRRVCAGAAMLLERSLHNAWLSEGDDGKELTEADKKTMRAAFDGLVASLRKCGAGQQPDRARVMGPSIKSELDRLGTLHRAVHGAFGRGSK